MVPSAASAPSAAASAAAEWDRAVPSVREPVKVLLVDDQAVSAEVVREMIGSEADLELHYCDDAVRALKMAEQVCPTVILQDLEMPGIHGLTLTRYFRAHGKTRQVPLIVMSSREEAETKAAAFAIGANDYLVKFPDRRELLARLRYHSKAYRDHCERIAAYEELRASRARLEAELQAGATYVRSLLPAPCQGDVSVDWRYVPCAELGGDSFGYHWIDDDHFAFYVLDVAGHGLGSALLGVSVANVLRACSLPQTDFHHPAEVIRGLNRAFPMEEHDGKCFTAWYGVIQKSTATLRWAGGGHPAVLLWQSMAAGTEEGGPVTPGAIELESTGPMIGMMEFDDYDECQVPLTSGATICAYTDGAFEIQRPSGPDWNYRGLLNFWNGCYAETPGGNLLDPLQEEVVRLKGSTQLDDDLTALQLTWNPR